MATMNTTPLLNTRAPAFNAIAARVQGADADDEDILERDQETDDEASGDEAIGESDERDVEDMSDDHDSSIPSVKTPVESLNLEDTAFTQDVLNPEDLPAFGDDLDTAKWTKLALWQEGGYEGMLKVLLKDEIAAHCHDSATISNADEQCILAPARMMVASMDKDILKAVIRSNLALQAKSNSVIKDRLDDLYAEAKDKPSIYYQLFVDDNGILLRHTNSSRSWTPWKDTSMLQTIPSRTRSTTSRNRTSICSGTEKDSTYREFQSAARVKEITRLIEKVRARLSGLPPQHRNKPLKHPLVHVGYSNRSQARLKKHASHSHSNPAMNLAEAIAAVLFANNTLPKLYKMTQYIIYICHTASHASLSEIVLTRLAEGYMGNGGGFSHYPAARSANSALKTSEQEWDNCAQYVIERSPLRENLKSDIERLKKKLADARERKSSLLMKSANHALLARVREMNERRKAGRSEEDPEIHQKAADIIAEFGKRHPIPEDEASI
ncbi:uncharacterized protein J4E84_010890 [Alternaria hordeiaustralica]|uniref:uncharacterized protein n=1 Tax=Alternaria hordeiaustralica TaxID=1187925 RepID=UPI0020C528A4|nr:uncharacterized protein J4E84_010890 [Alternaria hordeiaustralica]KAI4673818.1 hypothetical protein J4E84_010890 [Alternaria hordeiaustralica]